MGKSSKKDQMTRSFDKLGDVEGKSIGLTALLSPEA